MSEQELFVGMRGAMIELGLEMLFIWLLSYTQNMLQSPFFHFLKKKKKGNVSCESNGRAKISLDY